MIPRIPKKEKPRLFDKVIQELQDGLGKEISWLEHIFGKAERLIEVRDKKRYYYPNVYIGSNDYERIIPDETRFGNYAFFDLQEPQEVSYEIGARNSLKSPIALIVWLDMRSVQDVDDRNTEAVKRQILRALNGDIHLRTGRATFNKVYERAENVWRGYTIDEYDNQLMTHPFAAFRFEGVITTTDDCL